MPSTISPSFVYWLAVRVTEVLTKRLEKRGDKKSAKLLDNLVMLYILHGRINGEGVLKGMDDESLIDTVSEITYLIDFFKNED